MATRNGRGRVPQRPTPPKPPKKGKRGKKLWALTAVCALINTLFSLILRISDRKLAMAAIRDDKKLSVLYFGEKHTDET